MSKIQARRVIQGFTLVELMIVVVVIGVLAMIAYPSFTQQMRKSDRAEGRGALQELALAQESHRRTGTSYTTSMADLNVSLKLSGTDYVTSGGLYVVTVASADRGGFVAVARAAGRQLGDRVAACHAIAVQASLTGLRRGYLNSSNAFVESDECW